MKAEKKMAQKMIAWKRIFTRDNEGGKRGRVEVEKGRLNKGIENGEGKGEMEEEFEEDIHDVEVNISAYWNSSIYHVNS